MNRVMAPPKAAAVGDQPRPRRSNRRLNGRAEKAGLPEPPKRGRLCRDLALIDAALRLWQARTRLPTAAVWKGNELDS
jgi:hypothetical protein